MKPEPVVKQTVCSLCGLDWGKHGAKPSAVKCVELLKAELAKRPANLYPFQGSGVTLSSHAGIPIRPDVQIGKAS